MAADPEQHSTSGRQVGSWSRIPVLVKVDFALGDLAKGSIVDQLL